MIYWKDIDEELPEKDQAIFYIDNSVFEYCKSYGCTIPAIQDIDKGIYVGDNLVEWCYDSAPEEFKYWCPIPEFKFEEKK